MPIMVTKDRHPLSQGRDTGPDRAVHSSPAAISGATGDPIRDPVVIAASADPRGSDTTPLYWAIAFLIAAVVAALLGFFGLNTPIQELARTLFAVFIGLFVVSFAVGMKHAR